MSNPHTVFPYLEHAGWVHGLARSLVADWHTAEDLVQETWVRALERPERPGRGWLATVLRNNLLKQRMRDANRGAREREVSRDECTASTLDVVEKAMTHRSIVESVLALDEPYRETILLRYFEQYSCSEVARRMDVPKATVNSRISRALERLRARLTEQHDNNSRACRLALIPLANASTGIASSILGANLMNTILGLGALAASLTAVSVLATNSAEPGTELQTETGIPLAAEPVSSRTPFVAPDLTSIEDEQSAATREPVLVEGDDDDKDIWEAELEHDLTLDPATTEIVVSLGAGNIEIVEGSSGTAHIDAKIRADLDRVTDPTSRVFTDHVSLVQKNGKLEIEGAHDENGWKISLVVHVPAVKKLTVSSGAGSVVVRHAEGSVVASSGAGSVSVLLPRQKMHEVIASSGAGSVVVKVAEVEKNLTVSSGAGKAAAELKSGTSKGAVTISSGAGSASLTVPSSVIGDFELETGVGKAKAPAALGLQEEERFIGARLTGQVGVGGPKIRVSSGAGNVEVKFPGKEPVMIR